jgi:GNAT superfamily N-acetyltransferase
MMSTSYSLREAGSADASAMAKVRVDTWRSAYRGIVADDYLAGLSYGATAAQWRETVLGHPRSGTLALVAEDERDGIIGIAVGGPEDSGDPVYRAQVYVLYVLSTHQGRGIGRRLVEVEVRHFLDLRLRTMLIWVLAANPWRAFYEELGGCPVREKEVDIGGALYPEIGYGWDDLGSFAFKPEVS